MCPETFENGNPGQGGGLLCLEMMYREEAERSAVAMNIRRRKVLTWGSADVVPRLDGMMRIQAAYHVIDVMWPENKIEIKEVAILHII
jgi:hypothetical protein